MPTPVGEDTYRGLAVPLYGESRILQQNTSNAILSFMHSSDNNGRFWLGMNNYSTAHSTSPVADRPELNTTALSLTNLAVWDIDADGGYRAISGTTVLMELNSSGVFGREALSSLANWSIDSSGYALGLKQNVVTITTAANLTITAAQSGTLFQAASPSAGTPMFLILPGDASVGTWYDFSFTSGGADADFTITSTAGAGVIEYNGLVSSIVSTAQTITGADTEWHQLHIVLIATDRWVATGPGYQHGTPGDTSNFTSGDLERGAWENGTSIGA